jgi:hypothetical protein
LVLPISLIKPKALRWYRQQNGVVEACYQLPKKNGNGVKEPTLRDAKELGLLPSVTTILSVLAKPGLERWKLEQAIHSALTLPRGRETYLEWTQRLWPLALPVDYQAMLMDAFSKPAGYVESEDAFAQRVAQDMEEQRLKASEFGTRIHDVVAYILIGKIASAGVDLYPEVEPFLESFRTWANENIEQVHAVEKVVGGKQFGYAGRMDLDCTLKDVGRCIVDFKTQAVKEGKPKYWLEWPKQLAAYREASLPEDIIWDRKTSRAKLVSIVIDSAKPGPIHINIWDESKWGYLALFQANLQEWIYQNDYDPREIQ